MRGSWPREHLFLRKISISVVSEIAGTDISLPVNPAAASQLQSKVRLEYYGFVRRLPSQLHCELIFKIFFANVNPLTPVTDETIFREHLEHWWNSAYDILLKHGPEKLPRELQCFPALIFQILALTLQFLSPKYDPRIKELKFGPSQTFTELSREYTNCGVDLSRLVGKGKLIIVGVQHSFMGASCFMNGGDMMNSWTQSGETVKLAMVIGMHLEPEIPSSSRPEELLDALWMNELRKRIWLNFFCWDSWMALCLGQPMFINQHEITITPPIDCEIPVGRLKRIPVARSELEHPTNFTERLWRLKLSLRFREMRELEADGPIPQNLGKVKELHYAAVEFRKSLPHTLIRKLLTSDGMQSILYKSAVLALDNQEPFFERIQGKDINWLVGFAFPTFDAATLSAVVLVANPEHYQAEFLRPYQSLKKAHEGLSLLGSTMALARTGAETLQAVLFRVLEAQERVGVIIQGHLNPPHETSLGRQNSSSNSSVNGDNWQFELDMSGIQWMTQNPDFSDFDFSNLEVPMPLKELLLDEGMGAFSDEVGHGTNSWMSTGYLQGVENAAGYQESLMDAGENSL